MHPERDVDVLVVGSGAAGLAAALSAREGGAHSVVVAESEGLAGGSSRLSGGLMMGAGTRYQRALGIDDDAESLFHDYMQLNQWKVESAVVRRLAELAGPTVEWLGDLGVQFYDQLVFGGDERVPRVHCPIGRGQAVVDVLLRHCRRAGVEIALGRRVGRLLTEDGAVVGAGVGEDTLTAGAVVVATGGFGNSPEKLARYFPSAADTGWAWYIGAEGKFLQPITSPPFYGAEIGPATVCFTACGLRIDRDAQVIGESGRPVPGLFAAGESAGGVVGPRYVGSGNSYANCVTFGRVAGAAAARLVGAAP
jgi:succinate dehydrogenase/fumarate reductase flavoprotein subunit